MVLFYTTIATKDEALILASKIIDANPGACINIADNITSIYRWEGKIETSKEVFMLIKALKTHSKKIVELIKKYHPYTTPCILSVNCDSHNQDYEGWLTGNISEIN